MAFRFINWAFSSPPNICRESKKEGKRPLLLHYHLPVAHLDRIHSNVAFKSVISYNKELPTFKKKSTAMFQFMEQRNIGKKYNATLENILAHCALPLAPCHIYQEMLFVMQYSCPTTLSIFISFLCNVLRLVINHSKNLLNKNFWLMSEC